MKKISGDQLWDYAEGRLSGADAAVVEQLLATDADCRRQLEEIRSLSETLRSMNTEVPSMRFTANVMEAWDKEWSLRKNPLRVRTDNRVVQGVAAVFAGTLVLTCYLLIALSGGNLGLSGQRLIPGGGNWLGGMSEMLNSVFTGAGPYFLGATMILLMVLLERYIHYRHYIRGLQ